MNMSDLMKITYHAFHWMAEARNGDTFQYGEEIIF